MAFKKKKKKRQKLHFNHMIGNVQKIKKTPIFDLLKVLSLNIHEKLLKRIQNFQNPQSKDKLLKAYFSAHQILQILLSLSLLEKTRFVVVVVLKYNIESFTRALTNVYYPSPLEILGLKIKTLEFVAKSEIFLLKKDYWLQFDVFFPKHNYIYKFYKKKNMGSLL